MVEVKWTPVIIGLLIGIILGEILGILTSWGDIFGYLISTVYVGYSVDKNYTNGAIHGVLVGIVAAIIVLLISLFGLSAIYAASVVCSRIDGNNYSIDLCSNCWWSHGCHRWDHWCFIKKTS